MLVTRPGHGEPNPTYLPVANDAARDGGRHARRRAVGRVERDAARRAHHRPHPRRLRASATAPDAGVIDPYQRVYGYDGLHVADGSAVSANLGVNPSLTITAMTERAMSLWPNKGERRRPPAAGRALPSAGRPVAVPTAPAVPGRTAPAALRVGRP